MISSDIRLLDRYRIVRQIGEGGMGVVYAAHDERLDRAVAIKMLREGGPSSDPRARERLWREARAAAAINHPNVCQLYEIAEDQGRLFLAMELLDGESLQTKLMGGPLTTAEALPMMLSVLSPLDALHRRGIAHRDLKPSNIFLTHHGVKVLDFGLARHIEEDVGATQPGLTLPGTVVGTPTYMAPEQVFGKAVDARSDIFAAGILLFEMLSGKPPFAGDSMMSVLHAIAYEPPPVLTGSQAVDAADRIIRRALAKSPEDRFPSAGEMANEIRSALTLSDSGDAPRARAMTRLIVLPFRILRADTDTDFLAVALSDAVTASLSGLKALTVRSSLAAAKYDAGTLDLKTIAREADVDAVLAGTLMRAGDQVRVTAQLLEAPSGTVLWMQTLQAPIGDLFSLQDQLSRQIVSSLSVPLTMREEQMLRRDVPSTARAYEYYLRANDLGGSAMTLSAARDLYLQCLVEDPNYAPAHARLGRVCRIIASRLIDDPARAEKLRTEAEAAFRRALEINPDLPLAHSLFAYLEVERGRAVDAMLRLIECAHRGAADPQIFAGLVHTCRYCGLIDASVAAFERARRIDPAIRTSVAHSFWLQGDIRRAIETDLEQPPMFVMVAKIIEGRLDEAIAMLTAIETLDRADLDVTAFRAALQGNHEAFAPAFDRIAAFRSDPEHLFYLGMQAAFIGDAPRALGVLRRAVDGGFSCYSAYAHNVWLDPLRGLPEFAKLVRDAQEAQRLAAAAFLQVGGDRLLGVRAI